MNAIVEALAILLVFLAWPAVGLFLWAMFKHIYAASAGRTAAIWHHYGVARESPAAIREEWGKHFSRVYEDEFRGKLTELERS